MNPPSPDPGTPAPPGRRALSLVLHLVGLALLAAVLWNVPWADRAHLADGTVLRGRTVAESEASVTFHAAGEEVPRTLPRARLAVRERGLPAVEPGVASLAGRLQAGPVLVVFLIAAGSILLGALRWRLLLRAGGLPVTTGTATSLTLLGNFFNQVVPGGIVGGDVLKSWYAARGRERGDAAHAVVSVFADRVLGLVGMLLLAGAALAPRWEDPRFRTHALFAWGLLLVAGCAGVAILSRRVRAALRTDAWMPRIPVAGRFLAEADRAVLTFRGGKGALAAGVAMSVVIHCGWCAANVLLGGMLGIDLEVAEYFAVIPPILVVSAIPLLPGGWGIGEASYVVLLGFLGVPPAQAVAVSVLGRITNMFLALPGGLVFLARRAG